MADSKCVECDYLNSVIARFKEYVLATLDIDIDSVNYTGGIEMDIAMLKDESSGVVRFYRTFGGFRTNFGLEPYVEMPKSYIENLVSEHSH